MEAPLWLLICYSSVGAVDVIYNHLYRYRLYAHASSFTEHISHTLLTLGLTLTVAMLVFVEMGRVGFTIFLVIQALALLNTLWDVSIEPASRAPLGGLPPQEYFLHTVIFLLHGAFVWAVVANADRLVHGPGFGVVRWPPLPPLLLAEASVLTIIGTVLFGLHLYLLKVGSRAILARQRAGLRGAMTRQ
jgi:hypothetical protein